MYICIYIYIYLYTGINGSDTAIVTTGLANLHDAIANNLPFDDEKTKHSCIAKAYHKEANRINIVLLLDPNKGYA
jgi:hypothetical protein